MRGPRWGTGDPVNLYGIDVSHHQSPSTLNWKLLREEGCSFVIVRACYGAMHDRHAAEHIRRARDVGMLVGLYHFFRANVAVPDQLAAFRSVANACSYGRREDIVPSLDFEDDTDKRPILPEHAPLALQMLKGLERTFEQKPLLYITQRDFGRVGRPPWALEYPLWVAHYARKDVVTPATPAGRPWAIWQHRVGPFVMNGPNGYDAAKPLLDQNRAMYLPLLSGMMATHPKDAPFARGHDQLDDEDDGETNKGMAAMLAATLDNMGHAALERNRREALDEMSGNNDGGEPPENAA